MVRTDDAAATPLVSFATTAYQTERYVGDTIRSVLAQTDADWEMVVVDNGQVDAMAEAVLAFTDPRVRLVRQPNAGYIGGLQAAAAVCRGRFVVPLDSDDQVMATYVAEVRRLSSQFPAAVALACDAHLFSDEHGDGFGRGYNRSIGLPPPSKDGEVLTRHHLFATRIPYYGGAVRRDAWEAIGGYALSEPNVDEVIDFWLRLVAHGTVVMVPQRLGRYRVRGDSVTRDPAQVERFERTMLNSFVVHGADADAAERDAAQRSMSTLLYYQALRRARAALVDGDVVGARREARRALQHRRTVRAALVCAVVTVAPRLLLRLRPLKLRVTGWVSTRLPGSRSAPAHGEDAR